MSKIDQMIKDALYMGSRPRVHPNGFLQLDLGLHDTRLHIWHPDLPKQTVRTSIHDHVFHMRSTVELGTLEQVRYSYTLEHCGEPSDEIYMARYTDKSESTLQPTGVLIAQTRVGSTIVEKGETYQQPPFTFHDSVPATSVVMTIMEKIYRSSGEPRVIVPLGEEPDNSFSRLDADEDFLWDIIYETSEMLDRE